MGLGRAVLLGMIQGITEFFPISSSGHLVILQRLLGVEEPQMAFDIFLHLGTSAAVLAFFRKDILSLFGRDRKTLFLIILASVPACLVGLLFMDAMEGLFADARSAGYMLIVTGVWLGLASRMAKRKAAEKTEMGPANSFMIGLAQAVSVIPGISRSGATIGAGMMLGIDKEKACRFSFLLSIPAVLGASLLKSVDIAAGISSAEVLAYLAGGAVAMLTGVAAIKSLLLIVRSDRFYLFSAYCIAAGFLALIII